MFCDGYQERAIEMLYGELDPLDVRRVESHLAECEACRDEMRALDGVRKALGSAAPDVPMGPRVVILAAPARRTPVWAMAAGVAGLGLLAGMALSWSWQARAAAANLAQQLATAENAGSVRQLAATPATTDEFDRRVRDEVQRYLAAHYGGEPQMPKTIDAAELLTAAQLDARLNRFDRKLDRERASDLQYLLDQLAGVEARTTAQTEQALRYVALASDPRVSER